jgi:prepilin-type N-terminal cleavage/methylation domain-containing protein
MRLSTRILKNRKGFTLIELLIVIVIIGILAGVAISIIDPKKQQDRAQDATTKATMDKVGIVTESYISAYGEVPTTVEFVAGLKNVVEDTTDCDGFLDAYSCVFEIDGSPLPDTCDDSGVGSGSSKCYFVYEGNPTGDDDTNFVISAKSFEMEDGYFMLDNNMGTVQSCDELAGGCSGSE